MRLGQRCLPLQLLWLIGGIVVTALPAEGGNMVIGSGVDSCGTWTANRSYPNQAKADAEWVLGYVAGIGSLSGVDPLNGLDYGAVVSWVNNYCAGRPLDHIVDAAVALAIELLKRHGVKLRIIQ